MNTISVQTSNSYNVLVGNGILVHIGEYASSLFSDCKAIIISDSNVWPLYGNVVKNSLSSCGFEVAEHVISPGEKHKNLTTYAEILNFLARIPVSRNDVIIALGGGIVGDLAGFVAATYMRGIGYIQVPTTLLAMVDSSVGGKTAIDLPGGKNLIGAFYAPKLVVCDIDTLNTLPQEFFRDGCAEIIKYGVLYDSELIAHLSVEGMSFDRKIVITKCIALKCNAVEADEYDNGVRQMLNLGHTFGHAIETLSGYSQSHGCAISTGMAIVARAASKAGYCSSKTAEDIVNVLQIMGLPVQTAFTAQQLYAAACLDKKRRSDTINLILPHYIGSCSIEPMPICQLASFIEDGL